MKLLRDIIDPGDLIPDNATNGDIIKALFPDAPRVHKIIQNNFYTWWRTDFRSDAEMTRQEVKEILLDMANELQLIPESKQGQAFKMILELLDNENILDKIRADIAAIDIEGQVDDHTIFIRSPEQVKQMALNIIDKYKVESESQESKVLKDGNDD